MRLASTLGLAVSWAALVFVACSDDASVNGARGAAAGEGGGAAQPGPGDAGEGPTANAGQPGAAGAMSTAGEAGATTAAGAAQGGASGAEAGADAGGQAGADSDAPPPELSDFSPKLGLPGEVVTISGSNFDTTPANNAVTIGGVTAEVLTADATTLTVEVPEGAQTGKISITSRGEVLTSDDDFEVLKDIPRQGLVAFYPMSGDADDASGNALHGTVSGASLVFDRFGGASKAYGFDGVDDLINMGNPAALQIDTAITLAVWAKASTRTA